MEKSLPIIALDFNSGEDALQFMDQFQGESLNVKVGMALFYSAGPSFIQQLLNRGHHIFLDLKLHDIPNTVENAITVLATLGVHMINIHASGGKEMMLAAKRGLLRGTKNGKRPLLIAVTQLTSTKQEQLKTEQLSDVTIEESVLHYASLAKECGLDGVVCSPHESFKIKTVLGNDFLTVTPGIRLDISNNNDDQHRIMTPLDAKNNACDYIVVGRPITKSDNPKDTYSQILNDWRN